MWCRGSGVGLQTLIEHWNGRKWSVVPSPDTGPLDELTAVTSVRDELEHRAERRLQRLNRRSADRAFTIRGRHLSADLVVAVVASDAAGRCRQWG